MTEVMLDMGDPGYDLALNEKERLIGQLKDHAIFDVLHTFVLYEKLNKLVSACMDDTGKPKAPDRRELMQARACLPSQYTASLIKR